MLRLLFLTDTHIRGTSPKNRKDDFLQTLRLKLEEVISYAKENKVSAILHGGDIFDRPDIAPSVVREFAMLFRNSPVKIYAIAGNHDIYGHNPETISRTMLGLLDGAGTITLLTPGQKVYLRDKGITVQLTGESFSFELDQDTLKRGYIVKKDPAVDYAVHMVHGMLLTKPFIQGIPYTLVEQITSTEADITLAGHYHNGFGKIIEMQGKYFVNPGGIARINAHLSEIKRMPQVALLNFTLEKLDIKLLSLQAARPGDEVLDRTSIIEAEEREVKLHQFVQGIKAAGEFRVMKVQEILENIAASSKLAVRVKEEAMQRLQRSQEKLTQDALWENE